MRMFLNALGSGMMTLGITGLLSACSSTLPREYIDQAEPGLTLTTLAADPARYWEKVVILGGVIVEEKEIGDQVFLRLKNRPLDQDYKPQRPLSLDGSEAGHYWVMISRRDLPERYRDWARVTVVGQVAGNRPNAADSSGALEPVLDAMFLRGWGDSILNTGPSTVRANRNRMISVPKGARGEFSQ